MLLEKALKMAGISGVCASKSGCLNGHFSTIQLHALMQRVHQGKSFPSFYLPFIFLLSSFYTLRRYLKRKEKREKRKREPKRQRCI